MPCAVSVKAILGFDLSVVVGWQVLQSMTLFRGLVHVTEQVGRGKGMLDRFAFLGAKAEVLDLLHRTDAQQ